VNFTAGDDLSLFEIEAALNLIQNQAGPQAEIVMGVVNDERFYDRVEVILVVTGLGAPSMEESLPGFSTGTKAKESAQTSTIHETAAHTPSVQESSHQTSKAPEERKITQEIISAPASNDLDVPAFLRKARQVH
jgi:cell division protein FtsZ